MKLARTGIILNTEHYEACVAFYRNAFGLNVQFEKRDGDFSLTCFELGDGYLMVETGGSAKPSGKSIEESAAKLRFHVENLEAARRHLEALGISADIEHYEWGSTINTFDPDGNRVGIRDEEKFRRDLPS